MVRSRTNDRRQESSGRSLIDIYGPILPYTVGEPSDWDPSLAPDGFIPETAPDGRPLRTAAWDGGLSDLAVAPELYDTTPGAPAVLVYASIQAGAQVFEGDVVDGDANRFTLATDDGTSRTIIRVDDAGREDAIHGDNGAYIGEMCELRLAPTEDQLAAEQAAKEDQ